MNEVIKVNFDNENDCIKYVDGLTQWDYGLTLEVTGLDLEENTIEVHFSLNETVGNALRSIATVKDNILTVAIPSAILQSQLTYDHNAYAFIYLSSANTGKTVKKIVFSIKARPKPAEWAVPEEPEVLGQLIEQLNTKVNKVDGKDLSSNDYTDTDKNKLDSLPTKEELENDYAKKGTTLKEYGIEDAATKEELNSKISEEDLHIKYVESLDTDNPLYLRDFKSGMYILYGKFRPFNGSSAGFTFSSGMLVSIIKTSDISYVQIFYSKSNTLQYLEISDTEYSRNDAKLVNMESVANKITEITEDATDNQYASAKAVYVLVENHIKTVLETVSKDYTTKEELNNALEEINNIIATLAKTEEVEKEINTLTESIETLRKTIEETTENSQNIYANAVKATASGEVIRIDDVSPIEHTVKVKVSGKNLLNVDEMVNLAFVKNEDGTFTFTKNSSERFTEFVDFLIPANTIVNISATQIEGTADGFAFQTLNKDKTYTSIGSLSPSKNFATVKVEKEPIAIRLYLGGGETDGAYLNIRGLQLEIGETATEYEPYINPESVTVTGCGKNLFNNSDYALAIVNTDINERDGDKFTLRGLVGNNIMAYSAGAMRVLLKQGVKNKDKITVSLYITLLEQGIYDNRIRLWSLGKDAVTQEQRDFILTLNKRTKIVATYDTTKTAILNGITFYLNNNKALIELDTMQVEIGETATEYETYKGETYTPAADGTVNILSVAPTMTLLTDTEGINIEAEYNQDTNKAFDNVNADLEELDKVTAELIEDMGEVETALDNIITIQNALIGGDSS